MHKKNIVNEKNQFSYLDDINGNLDFLYKWSGAIASARMFGAKDDDLLSFVGGHILNDSGDVLTLDGIHDLQIFHLADLMLRFFDSGRRNLRHRVTENPYFCKQVEDVFFVLSDIPNEEVDEARKKSLALASHGEKFVCGRKSGAKDEITKYISEIIIFSGIKKTATVLWPILLKIISNKSEEEKCPLYVDNEKLFEAAQPYKEFKFKRFQAHITKIRKIKNPS